MASVYDLLLERGFIEQTTHEDEIKHMLENEKVTFYIGFDPTADSLTIGHFLTVMAMKHMQNAGHRPIALVGGGTGFVGDPTDKTEMRRVMDKTEINSNVSRFKEQLSKFISFDEGKAIMVDNADWLLELKYIPFIRDYGIHFSVNKMLTSDAYRKRFEKGLSFFEFNYMLMQAYDFLELSRRYDCKIQLGGNDQWSNILAGVDLIRRVESKKACGMTFKLLTTADGKKMGKSMSGAIWLDPNKTSPYDFFQYWRNIDDADVINCLKLLTFLPMDYIRELEKLEGMEINKAKEVLAFEVTKIVHSEEDAQKSLDAAKALFAGAKDSENIPSFELDKNLLDNELDVITLLVNANLVKSKSDGRRIVEQGGLKINEQKIDDIALKITSEHFINNEMLVQKGKKVYLKIKI